MLQPGESLEEAVRRETREEVGIEIGEVVHHSSQPWPGASPFISHRTTLLGILIAFTCIPATLSVALCSSDPRCYSLLPLSCSDCLPCFSPLWTLVARRRSGFCTESWWSFEPAARCCCCCAVGYGTQQCQLMVGFFAHAKTADIQVDEAELAGTSTLMSGTLEPTFSIRPSFSCDWVSLFYMCK